MFGHNDDFVWADILREMAHCSKQYLNNRCEPLQRIPHMEETCRAWEECMHRDPSAVGRARVFAETAAQVINGFVEEISWKTLVGTTFRCICRIALNVCISFEGIHTCISRFHYRLREQPSQPVSSSACTWNICANFGAKQYIPYSFAFSVSTGIIPSSPDFGTLGPSGISWFLPLACFPCCTALTFKGSYSMEEG